MSSRYRVLLPAVVLLAGISGLVCERPTDPARPNLPPVTSLANIPKEMDTIFALATLHWNGGDDDGYVAGYQYRAVTYHLLPATVDQWREFDSTNWTTTTATSMTVAFNSSDSLNLQRFMVRAIDNNGAADPTPAEKHFITTRTLPPVAHIKSPGDNTKMLARQTVTDWWPGVKLVFEARDPEEQGKVVEYAWAVDGGPWTWTTDTTVYVMPNLFTPPLSGAHLLRATARDNTNLVAEPDTTTVILVEPTFEKDILMVDETDEFNAPFVGSNIPDSVVDNYYLRLFNPTDTWDFIKQGMPPREVLGQYKLLVWYADDLPSTKPHKLALPENIVVVQDYLNVGGKFFMSGWRILKSFAFDKNFPFVFSRGNFVYDYLHIEVVDETTPIGDMTYCIGVGSEFSDIRVDSTKLAKFPYGGKLGQVNIIPARGGFTDVLYSYQNDPQSPFVQYRGRATGLRYYGTVFDAVVLGFPMYFIREDDARVAATEVKRSLGIP